MIKSTPSRIMAVDGLRAVAMTLVVAQHCGLAPFGWTGVWLFYVISGFVICRNFMATQADSPHRQYKDFIRRRFFRIVPAYVFYISVVTAVMTGVGRYSGLHDIPFLMTFTYNWQMIFQYWPTPDGWSSVGHLWTLSVEEQFYVFFPLLFLFLPRRMFILVAGMLILAGPSIRLVFSTILAGTEQAKDPNWTAFAIYAASFTQFDAFLIGALIGLFETDIRARPQLSRTAGRIAAGAVLAYAGTYVVVNYSNGDRGIDLFRNIVSGTLFGQAREVFVYSTVDIVCAAVLISALCARRMQRLVTPAMALVGRISYGGYLYHALVLWFFVAMFVPTGFKALPVPERIAWFVAAWAATVGLAYVSFFWFETPIMNWSRRSHRDPHPAAGIPSRGEPTAVPAFAGKTRSDRQRSRMAPFR